MSWLFELHETQPIAHAIGVLACVCVVGMALGSLKFRGIGLGTAGVLFAGILVGQLGEAIDHRTLDFVKDFGLVVFVFTLGLQLGPGFFAALRQQGVKMNAFAFVIVILGAARIGRIGRQVWHMPVNANLAFREFGIALFFAAVGLSAAPKFFATAFSAIGFQWLLAGACVSVLPLLLIGIFARAVWK